MKQIETFLQSHKKYDVLMILCFLYGGFLIFLFLFNVYSDYWRFEYRPEPNLFIGIRGQDSNQDSNFPPRGILGDRNERLFSTPLSRATSPVSLFLFLGGLISLLSGLAIWRLTKRKETAKIKEMVTDNLLLPDEKAVIKALKELDFNATQSMLSKKTGLNKVQVHRAIKRLEAKKLVRKHEFGMTNKIILEKEYFEG